MHTGFVSAAELAPADELNSCGRCVVMSVELCISVKHPIKSSVSHYFSAPKISMGFGTCPMNVKYST